MIRALNLPRWSLWSAKRPDAGPVPQGNGASMATGEGRGSICPDQAEFQRVTVLQIIERVCASHQAQLGFYSFFAGGDFRRQV